MKKIICSIMFFVAMIVLPDLAYGSMNCPETPAPNEVLLYTEENFQGECTSYVGYNREIEQHKTTVRSLKIGSGITVSLYKLYRFRGQSLYEDKSEIPVFDPQEKRGNWRSIKLSKKPAPVVSVPKPCAWDDKLNPGVEAADEQVTIFTEQNFGGSCKTIDYTGRNPESYSYSIPYSAPNKQEFWNDGTRRKQKPTFNSMMVGSGVVVTICTGENLKGTCKEFTDTVIDLTGEGFGYNSINSFKIFSLDPKLYKNPMLPNDNQVTICQERVFGGGCRKLSVGNYDLNSLIYQYIHVGKNVKAQTYGERSFFGDFEVYQGGSKQASTSQIRSLRVMSSNDQLMAIKVRPTPVPIPVSTPDSTVDNSPVGQANREKVYILNGSGTKCLTIKDGNADNFTPVLLADCVNSESQQWTFTSDGKIRGLANLCLSSQWEAIQLRTCSPDGAQNWLVSDKNEIKRAWACLSEAKLKNGSPGVTDCNGQSEQRWRFENNVAAATSPTTPSSTPIPTVKTPSAVNPIDGPVRVVGKTELGLTVLNQQIQSNSNIILHSGFNNWMMRADGAIVLKDNPRFGLTVKNQRIANGSEIILHEGYNLWKVLSNGAIVLRDNPSFGITVLNQNLNDNAKIILHIGYNTWTKDHTRSANVANNNPPPPPKANHYPPPNSGGSPYVFCGSENQRCNFQGIGTVAYGVNGIFKYKQNVERGIQCNDANFGFVVKDVEKRCYFKFEREIVLNTTPTETDKLSPPNGNFRVCGVEGKTCDFRGTGVVAYGYNEKNGRKFLFKRNVNGRIACNNQTFGGDPAPGKDKVCYVQIDR